MKAKTKIAIKVYARQTIGYSIFFLTTTLFGFLLGKFIESLFIIAGYFATRFLVPKIKHFNTTQVCIFVSTLTFLFSIAILCIPKHISVLWSVGVGAIIPLIMYAESLLFDVKLSDKDKLIALCKEHNYNDLKTEIAIKFFIENKKPKEVWLWLCKTQDDPMEWDSVKKLKWKMKKELFNIEKHK